MLVNFAQMDDILGVGPEWWWPVEGKVETGAGRRERLCPQTLESCTDLLNMKNANKSQLKLM